MATVSAEIKRFLKEKDREIITGEAAIRAVLKDLQEQTISEIGKAALGSWDAYNLRRLMDAIERQIETYGNKAQSVAGGFMDKTWTTGVAMVDAALVAGEAAGGVFMGRGISTSSLDALKSYGNSYLESAFGDAWYKIKGEINLGVLGVKTPQEVAAAVGKSLDGPGIYKSIAERAETIARTEMGRVFSEAAQIRMDEAAQHVKGLEKQWRHVGHPKVPRPQHAAMDGHHVPVDAPFFQVDGIPIMFPRDPKAPIKEVIHCGCDHVPYHARWQ